MYRIQGRVRDAAIILYCLFFGVQWHKSHWYEKAFPIDTLFSDPPNLKLKKSWLVWHAFLDIATAAFLFHVGETKLYQITLSGWSAFIFFSSQARKSPNSGIPRSRRPTEAFVSEHGFLNGVTIDGQVYIIRQVITAVPNKGARNLALNDLWSKLAESLQLPSWLILTLETPSLFHGSWQSSFPFVDFKLSIRVLSTIVMYFKWPQNTGPTDLPC